MDQTEFMWVDADYKWMSEWENDWLNEWELDWLNE